MTDLRDAPADPAPAPQTSTTPAPPAPRIPQQRAPEHSAASDYWYPDGHTPSAVDVLNLLRRYRAAESAMRARTRASMHMNETDLLALRHLLQAQQRGQQVRQRDLADVLEISSASVTALVDRLEASGHVERRKHPTDRRAVVVVATKGTDDEVRETLGDMHQRMIRVVDGMTPDELRTTARFLAGMIAAVEQSAERDAH